MLNNGMAVLSGLDIVLNSIPRSWRRGRVGLVTNVAATTCDFTPAAEALQKAGVNLVALFAPEHGFHIAQPAGAPALKRGAPYRTAHLQPVRR